MLLPFPVLERKVRGLKSSFFCAFVISGDQGLSSAHKNAINLDYEGRPQLYMSNSAHSGFSALVVNFEQRPKREKRTIKEL
jgi:hypothetical protein